MSHGCYNRYGSWHHTGVVTTFNCVWLEFAIMLQSFLWDFDTCYWFKGYPKANGHPVGDAALDAARIICLGAAIGIELIVVSRALHGYRCKTAANFKAFDGIDG